MKNTCEKNNKSWSLTHTVSKTLNIKIMSDGL